MKKISENLSVCVIGLGYIGLPTASLLATKGFRVRGVDINPKVVTTINSGKIHIFEPDLDILVRSATGSKNLVAATEPAAADVFIVSVPTPFKDGFVPDLTFTENAVRSIAPHLASGNLVVIESTIPVGTTEAMARLIHSLRPDLNSPESRIFVTHCPERVLPGKILIELVENDRVIGGIDQESSERARDFYARFVNGEILLTTARTAELSKLSENAFRDVNIAFANELSLICDQLNINTWELIRLANRHPRVNILNPGAGVGGHCIAVDPWFIVDSAPEQARLIRSARQVNNSKPHFVTDQILRETATIGRSAVVACFGLSYKANIDDVRESPAIEIVEALSKKFEGKILLVEPHVNELPAQLQNNSRLEKADLESAISRADVLVLLVGHDEFLQPLAPVKKKLQEVLASKRVVDPIGGWKEFKDTKPAFVQ